MNSKNKELSGNVLLFAIATFVPKLISFLLVRLYTGYLSTTDYGIADLIATTCSLLLPIFTCSISNAILRYALDKEYDKKDVFAAGLDYIIKSTCVVFILALILCFIPGFPIKAEYILFILLNYIANAFYSVFIMMCKSIDKVRIITWAAIINTVVTISANLLFLPVFNWGLRGFLIANVSGNIAACIVVFWGSHLYKYVGKYNSSLLPLKKSLLKYGLPLIFTTIAWWVNNASDRYMVSAIVGTAANGVYAVGYKIPNIFESIQGVFMQAWTISAIKHFDPDDSDRFIGKNYTLLNGLSLLSCSALMIVNIYIARLLFANEFFEAWHYVPLLITGAAMHAFSTFMGQLLLAAKEMKAITVTVLAGTITNIILNALLIPFIGAMGAAVATLCSYAVIFISRYIYLKKLINVRHEKFKDFCGITILCVQMIFALLGQNFILWQIPFFVVLILLYRSTILELVKQTVNMLPFGKKKKEQ